MNCAGFPPTTVLAFTSLNTADRAPTTAPSSTVTPGPTKQPAVTHDFFPIVIGLH